MSQEQWKEVCEDLDIPCRARSVSGALVSLCVFHDEREPSLFMYPEGYYVCYGCSSTGSMDVFRDAVTEARAEKEGSWLAWKSMTLDLEPGEEPF